MALVSNTAARRAILAWLKSDATVTALVPAGRIYQPQAPAKPTWPFVQYGVFSDLPRRAACLEGQTLIGAIHAFAKGPGDDAANAIGAALASSLDGRELVIAGGTIRIRYTGGQTLRDTADANSWHRVTNLSIRVLT